MLGFRLNSFPNNFRANTPPPAPVIRTLFSLIKYEIDYASRVVESLESKS